MPKSFPEEQRIMVIELAAQGKSHVDIAKIMLERFPDDWNSKHCHRTIARIVRESSDNIVHKTLDEMTREERTRYIEGRMQATPRFRMACKNFSDEERDVFVDEYMNVVRSTETLTEVEEQALFASILELILAFQALNRKEKEEKWRDESLDKKIPENDPRFRRIVDDKYQREYDQHMKLYQRGMEQLKMSRKDRLKEVRSHKQTLLDLAESLSHKTAYAEAATEIERLSKMKDEELKRLMDSNYLYGVFEL